ncbi:MAG: FAD binding domain-containing protein [Sphaerochaetaceae bacterium]
MLHQFIAPQTISEALNLHRAKTGSVYYAGGTEINRLGSTVKGKSAIGLQALGLDGISKDEHGVHIGAMVTFQKALESEFVPDVLKTALSFMGSFTKRNMATIGGNVAMCSDDSYIVCTLLALRARLETAQLAEDGSYSEENLPLREYHAHFDQYKESLILEVVVPNFHRFVASRRFSRTIESHSAVTCAFGCECGGKGMVSHSRMYAAIKGTGLIRFKETENLIEQQDHVRRDAFHATLQKEITAIDDVTGGGAYKRYITEEAFWEMYEAFHKEEV